MQCLSYDRVKHLEEMLHYVTNNIVNHLHMSTEKLIEILGATVENVKSKHVLLAYSGGKDSSYMVSFTRFMQLMIYKKFGDTFHLRIFTYRHPGVPKESLENIDRVYSALRLYEDPYAEMLLFDEKEIRQFDKNALQSKSVKLLCQRDVLMSGHLCQGDGRPTFCNTCNINFVRSLVVAAQYQNYHADVFITGDSSQEMKSYCKWVRNLSKEVISCDPDMLKQFHGFQGYKAVGKIASAYYEEINKCPYNEILDEYTSKDDNTNPIFFSIFDYTEYEVASHWEFLTEYLRFKFGELSFSFTESDCTNPAIMAHIRGIKSEYLYKQSYEHGILDYLQLAIKLMKEKHFPDSLIMISITRYLSDPGILAMRKKIQEFFESSYGISENNIICMVFSPFTDKGIRMYNYLESSLPKIAKHSCDILSILARKAIPLEYQEIFHTLSHYSGLSFEDMCVLFNSTSLLSDENSTIMKKVLRDDPHKIEINTMRENKTSFKEIISGR